VNKFSTIFLALLALSAPAAIERAAAASAEDAIKAWVAAAAVPGTDWKVTYADLAYDGASDRTTVKGLTAAAASLRLTIGFDTVAITGYAATANGGFSAALLTADGGRAASDKAAVKIAGLAVKDFGTASAMAPVALDIDHPLGSIVNLYSELLKVHLGHAGLASLTFTDAAADSDFSYSNFAIDNWANGKIGSMTMGAMDATFTDDSGGPVRFQIGGFETRDTDLDAIVRVYDPARYQNGVGDQVWRTAIGLAAYHDLSIQSPGFDMTLGAWRMENFKVRQPQHSFTAALDAAMKAGTGAKNAPPALVKATADLWSAFGLGKFSVSDVMFDSDGGYGTLGAFTLADASADGIGEISIDKLDADTLTGFTRIGRLAAGNIVFPGVDKLMQAFDAMGRNDDVDFGGLGAKLGYLEAAGVDVQTDAIPETMLAKFRLDLSNYVGVVPTDIALSIAGLDAPVELFNEAGADTVLRDLGYDRVRADYGVKLAWHEADKTVTVDELKLSLADMGSLSGKATLGGLTREALGKVASLGQTLATLDLLSSSLTISDSSFLNRWIAQQAFDSHVSQTAYRQQLADTIPPLLSGIGDAAFQKKLTAALTTYITRPGSITLSAMPPAPVPVSGTMLLGTLFPAALPDALGLDVSAVAGPVPVPYDYQPRKLPAAAPPVPPTPPAATPDVRHVPEKK
jgi:hypothetical protein